MASYLSSIFANSRPLVAGQTQTATPPPSNNDEDDQIQQQQQDDDTPRPTPPLSGHVKDSHHFHAQSSTSAQTPQFPLPLPSSAAGGGDQYQVLAISNILAQNSNLLAQNLELQRQMEQLRASVNNSRDDKMEKWKRELREEVKDMIEGAMSKLVDTLAELQPAPSSRSGQQVGASAASREFDDLVNDHSSSHHDEVMGESSYQSGQSPWNLNKGKNKAVEGGGGGGVDPNALKIRGTRPTFTPLDNDLGSEERMGGMDSGWEDYVDMSPLSRNTTEHLSQGGDDSYILDDPTQIEQPTGSNRTTISPSVYRSQQDVSQALETPTPTPTSTQPARTASGRPIRQVSRVSDYSAFGQPEEMPQSKRKNARGTSHSTTKPPESTQSTGRKKAKKTHGKKKARARPSASLNKSTSGKSRTFKGRVSMNARPLGRSDGIKRGEGVWMEKGMNTVKGNMQEIACDVCNGRVHWACAGLEDDSIPPDDWECPDCIVKIAKGEQRYSIAKSPQTQCIRPTCILREKKKILFQEGDTDQYYVEKYIGRRAIGRTPDRSSRIFEYLVKWLGWPRETSTWEHESQFPPTNHFADDFLRECASHGVETKKRVALLPEARRWFDSEGEAIDTDAEAEAEEEEEEGEEVEEVVVGRQGNVHGNGGGEHDSERKEIVQYVESDESDSD